MAVSNDGIDKHEVDVGQVQIVGAPIRQRFHKVLAILPVGLSMTTPKRGEIYIFWHIHHIKDVKKLALRLA